MKSLDGICTFRAADLLIQFLELQEQRNNQSSMTNPASTIPEPTPQSSVISQSVHPSVVHEGGVTPHPGPAPVGPSPDVSRPAYPDVLGLRDFCETDVQARSSPIPDAPAGPNDRRNTSTTFTDSEATLLRKSTLRRLLHLCQVINQPIIEDTDLEKLKSLQNGVIPRVEKAILELESALQKYSRIANPMDLDEVTDQVDPVIEEASNFISIVR